MDLKSCSRCGRIHPRGYKCNVGRKYEREDADKLRNQRKWKKKAAQIKADDKGLCAVCLAKGLYTYENLEVHHITKLREDPSGLLEDDNLITLCRYHHRQADAGELKKEYLMELIKKRNE